MGKIPLKLNKVKIEEFCKKYHIAYLALFGSVLTPYFTPQSDVDVLIKFEQEHVPHIFGIVKMEMEFSDIIGRPVDLKTPNDLSVYFRNDVLAHSMIIYGE